MNGSVREFLELGPKSVLDDYWTAGDAYGDTTVSHKGCDKFVGTVPEGTVREVLELIAAHEKTHVLRHYTEVADGT